MNGDYCQRGWVSSVQATGRSGYISQQDSQANYNSGADLQPMYWLLTNTQNSGQPSYKGYYSLATQAVVGAEKGRISDDNCSGTQTLSCFLPGGNARKAADQPHTRTGTLASIGGVDPVPSPRISGAATGATTNASLVWDAAFAKIQDAVPAPILGYRLYRYVDSPQNNTCDLPTDLSTWSRRTTQPGTTFVDSLTDIPPNSADCVFYAIRIVYQIGTGSSTLQRGDDADPGEVTSVLSQASAAVSTNPAAVQIVNFTSKYVGKNTFRIGWNVGTEVGVAGYYVARASSQSGPFTRVSPQIAPTGDGSVYSYLDKVTRNLGTTFYYQLQVVNTDGSVNNVGPTSASLPNRSQKAN